MAKRAAFEENARLLREALGIVPLLYGSLGLEVRTGLALGADDIDVLIPAVHLGAGWDRFRRTLEAHGYTLIDEREHEFMRDGIAYAYAPIEDLADFAGVREEDIPLLAGCRLMTLAQYLQVYRASAKDGYRVEVRGKKDGEKIALIEKLLAEEA